MQHAFCAVAALHAFTGYEPRNTVIPTCWRSDAFAQPSVPTELFYEATKTSAPQATQLDFDGGWRLSAADKSVFGPGGYENIISGIEAPESSVQSRLF